MTEQEKKLGDKFAAYSILPKAEQRGFLIAYRLLEDEIDELTKEVERLRKENERLLWQVRLPDTPDFKEEHF